MTLLIVIPILCFVFSIVGMIFVLVGSIFLTLGAAFLSPILIPIVLIIATLVIVCGIISKNKRRQPSSQENLDLT